MNTEPLDARPRTMKDICAYYGVSYRTMKKMLAAVGLSPLSRKKGSGLYYYNIGELRQIAERFAQTTLPFD